MIRAASTLAVGGALMAASASAATPIKVDSAFPLPPFYKVDKPLSLETASVINEPAGIAPHSPATASVRKDTHKLIYSDTLPGNLLPNFQAGSIEGSSGLKRANYIVTMSNEYTIHFGDNSNNKELAERLVKEQYDAAVNEFLKYFWNTTDILWAGLKQISDVIIVRYPVIFWTIATVTCQYASDYCDSYW